MTLGNANEVAYWITEREAIRQKKEAGFPRPWTQDPILNTYRFCNVHREDDKVTRWIAKHWRTTHAGSKVFVGAIALSRMVNWPPTLERIGFPDPWDTNRIISQIEDASRYGKTWSSAYIVSTNGVAIAKPLYVVRDVLQPIVQAGIMPDKNSTLQAFWARLREYNGFGSFMSAQIVADLKHTHHLKRAPDWWTWAAPGPGSMRGLGKYFNGAKPTGSHFLPALQVMIEEVRPLLPKGIAPLCAQDWQNVMCEYDKWRRVKDGHGAPKAFYSPTPDFS